MTDRQTDKQTNKQTDRQTDKLTDRQIDSLHTNITRLSAKCSLLFISVMSHGKMGALCGPDGVMLPVKDLIDQISYAIPAEIPLVIRCNKVLCIQKGFK